MFLLWSYSEKAAECLLYLELIHVDVKRDRASVKSRFWRVQKWIEFSCEPLPSMSDPAAVWWFCSRVSNDKPRTDFTFGISKKPSDLQILTFVFELSSGRLMPVVHRRGFKVCFCSLCSLPSVSLLMPQLFLMTLDLESATKYFLLSSWRLN